MAPETGWIARRGVWSLLGLRHIPDSLDLTVVWMAFAERLSLLTSGVVGCYETRELVGVRSQVGFSVHHISLE